jgi:hypothetical protein
MESGRLHCNTGRTARWVLVPLLLGAALAAAEDRLAVFEFFGRQGCSICSSAGPALTSLQDEMAGRAVLLEYDVDSFRYGRQDRFWVSQPSATYLPLAMVGSGYRATSGPAEFEDVFRSMLDDEAARPARAEVSAFWRRNWNYMRVYVEVRNLGSAALELDDDGSVWLIAYENAHIGHSSTWVRSTEQQSLPFDLAPGESATLVFDSPPMSGIDWDTINGLVLVEDRPTADGVYDMLQATHALPADLVATPDVVEFDRRTRELEIVLEGPHVLEWTVTSNVPWIEVTPSSGGVPETVTLKYHRELQPLLSTEGAVTFSATGDEMSFESSVAVTAPPGYGYRRATRRLAPVSAAKARRR